MRTTDPTGPDADATHVLLGETNHQRRKELAERAGQLLAWRVPTLDDVTRPDQAPLTVLTLPEVPLRSSSATEESADSGRLRLDQSAGLLWTVVTASESDWEAATTAGPTWWPCGIP